MKYTTVSIPEPLHKRIQKIIKKTGFPSTSSFVIYILREVLAEETDPVRNNPSRSSAKTSKHASHVKKNLNKTASQISNGAGGALLKDKEKIRERLKALGYL